MMPQPHSDYMADALARQIINETERMQGDVMRLVYDGEGVMASDRVTKWREDVFMACHEMHKASGDTIRNLQQEVGALHALIPYPSRLVKPL